MDSVLPPTVFEAQDLSQMLDQSKCRAWKHPAVFAIKTLFICSFLSCSEVFCGNKHLEPGSHTFMRSTSLWYTCQSTPRCLDSGPCLSLLNRHSRRLAKADGPLSVTSLVTALHHTRSSMFYMLMQREPALKQSVAPFDGKIEDGAQGRSSVTLSPTLFSLWCPHLANVCCLLFSSG